MIGATITPTGTLALARRRIAASRASRRPRIRRFERARQVVVERRDTDMHMHEILPAHVGENIEIARDERPILRDKAAALPRLRTTSNRPRVSQQFPLDRLIAIRIRNCTVPVGTPVLGATALRAVVKVTFAPGSEGLDEDVTRATAAAVWMVNVPPV